MTPETGPHSGPCGRALIGQGEPLSLIAPSIAVIPDIGELIAQKIDLTH
jgi:hypothetical protein